MNYLKFHCLPDDCLVGAYFILYGGILTFEEIQNRPKQVKIDKVKSVLKGEIVPHCEAIQWYNFFEYLNKELVQHEQNNIIEPSYEILGVEYEYEYNNKIYCFKDKADKGDKKSEVQIFNFSSKKELEKKIRPKYYNRVIFHFVDGNIENYLPQIIPCTNALSFFTLDDEESLFYKLGEEELKNFFRLYDDKSNKKIEELEREGIIDSKKERLLKGLFFPSEKNI